MTSDNGRLGPTAVLGMGGLAVAAVLMMGGAGLAAAARQPAVAEPPPSPRAVSAAATLEVTEADAARYHEHVLTLANPFFEGRRPGTRGNELAADYIEFWFDRLGLEPLFPQTIAAADGTEVVTPGASYRQAFPYGRETVVEEQSVRVVQAGGSGGGMAEEGRTLVPGKDYTVLGVSGTGSVSGEVVFAGYGIDESSSGFTSFPAGSGRDVLKGKIAMVLRFEPVGEDGRSALSGGAWSNAAALPSKLRTVAERGASAIILTSPPGAADERINTLETTAATTRIARALSIPVIMMSMDAADELVRAGDPEGRSLLDLRKVADKGEKLVPLTGAAVSITTRVGRPSRTTENVAGVLRGRGALAEQYLIVGAHFDHVGDGSLGGSRSNEVGVIHYGADDNASGTAGMLLSAEQLAREYAALPDGADARSIIFMGFSAEEIGLIGSRYFVQNSPIAASATYAMINMDMIGRLRNETLEVHGTGTAEGFEAILEPMFESSGLTVAKQPGGRGPSDHASFYAASVPVLHFFTGLHEEYHTPRDVTALLNIEGGAHVASLASRVTSELAMRAEPLVFRSTDARRGQGKDAAAAAPTAPAAPAADPHAAGDRAQMGGVGGVRVRFGISPGSYSDGEPGVLVGEVFPDTSAAEAGIVKGDRLMKWNGKAVEDVVAWMEFLRAANPGDEVNVVVKREGREVPLKVKLKGRDQGAR